MGMFFSEYAVGQSFVSPRRTVTEADVVNFAGLSGDYNPLHTDAVFAESTPFKQRVAHGMLSVAISTGLGQLLGIFEGTTLALMSITSNFKAPVFFGDTVKLRLTVASLKPSSKGGRGVVEFTAEIVNQRDEVVVDGGWTVMFLDKV
jgi:acyl dehydratase